MKFEEFWRERWSRGGGRGFLPSNEYGAGFVEEVARAAWAAAHREGRREGLLEARGLAELQGCRAGCEGLIDNALSAARDPQGEGSET